MIVKRCSICGKKEFTSSSLRWFYSTFSVQYREDSGYCEECFKTLYVYNDDSRDLLVDSLEFTSMLMKVTWFKSEYRSRFKKVLKKIIEGLELTYFINLNEKLFNETIHNTLFHVDKIRDRLITEFIEKTFSNNLRELEFLVESNEEIKNLKLEYIENSIISLERIKNVMKRSGEIHFIGETSVPFYRGLILKYSGGYKIILDILEKLFGKKHFFYEVNNEPLLMFLKICEEFPILEEDDDEDEFKTEFQNKMKQLSLPFVKEILKEMEKKHSKKII